MADYKEDALELAKAVSNREPDVQVVVKKRLLRRSWFVRVTRNGVVADYEDIYHYGLAEALFGAFGRGRQ